MPSRRLFRGFRPSGVAHENQGVMDAVAGRWLAGIWALEAPPPNDAPALCAGTPLPRMGMAVTSECWSARRHAGQFFASIAAISACSCYGGGTRTMTWAEHGKIGSNKGGLHTAVDENVREDGVDGDASIHNCVDEFDSGNVACKLSVVESDACPSPTDRETPAAVVKSREGNRWMTDSLCPGNRLYLLPLLPPLTSEDSLPTSKKQLSLDSRWYLHTDHGCQ